MKQPMPMLITLSDYRFFNSNWGLTATWLLWFMGNYLFPINCTGCPTVGPKDIGAHSPADRRITKKNNAINARMTMSQWCCAHVSMRSRIGNPFVSHAHTPQRSHITHVPCSLPSFFHILPIIIIINKLSWSFFIHPYTHTCAFYKLFSHFKGIYK